MCKGQTTNVREDSNTKRKKLGVTIAAAASIPKGAETVAAGDLRRRGRVSRRDKSPSRQHELA
jgi:hypothetical protein